MARPCFLVIDREFPGSISTRKLVIETAKFNVLTAYSGQEALEIFNQFPSVAGVVLDTGLDDVRCNDLAHTIKALRPDVPIIVIVTHGFNECPHADFHLDSFDPAQLLEILKKIVPAESAAIEKRNEELGREKY